MFTLSKSEPLPVANDPATLAAAREWLDAQRAVAELRPRYERLKTLVNQPANQTLGDLRATPEEQDEAFGTFPTVACEFREIKEQAARARTAFDKARAAATAARLAWFEAQRDERVARLVQTIEAVYSHVSALHDLAEEAGREQVGFSLPEFPLVPLRIGSTAQSGLESVIHDLRCLVPK